jgi:hypothetical protein
VQFSASLKNKYIIITITQARQSVLILIRLGC